MAKNRLQELHDVGQSIWLDSIDRRMLNDGELDRRIREDALTGMTSNPTIFQKALSSSNAYDDQITDAEEKGLSSWELFELQEADYREEVLPSEVRARLSVEPGVALGWKQWVGDHGDSIALDRFGASAPGTEVLERRRRRSRKATYRGRYQRQHHAALRHSGTRARDRGVYGRSRRSRESRSTDRWSGFGGQLLRQPRRYRDR